MPHVPAMPPADRVFARLAHFAVSCPRCGEVIDCQRDQRRERPGAAHRAPRISRLIWNPRTQRLRCPHCTAVYMVGLVLFGVQRGQRCILTAPADTIPTAHERAELARLGGAWYLEQGYEREGQPVNLAVEVPCSCPVRGWEVTCAVHGDPAAGAHGV